MAHDEQKDELLTREIGTLCERLEVRKEDAALLLITTARLIARLHARS